MPKTQPPSHHSRSAPLPDQHQNYWQMASIQAAAFGIPTLFLGTKLATQHGAGTVIISTVVGNLILWLIGLATIAMTIAERTNAIDNLTRFIGKTGQVFGIIAISFAFLFWYTLQLTNSSEAVTMVLGGSSSVENSLGIRIGAILGIFTALLSVGGIKMIRWINCAALPLLLGYMLYAIIQNDSLPTLAGTWGLSIQATISTVLIALPAMVLLPTFFRHRASTADAFFALSLFVLLTVIIESLSVFLINTETSSLFAEYLNHNLFELILSSIFIVLALVCANLVNIYYVSAVWEATFPWTSRSKELAIVGMIGTVIFTFLQNQQQMLFLENIASSLIANLGVVVVIGYIVQKLVVHRQRSFELTIGFLCWLFGSFVTVVFQYFALLEFGRAFSSGLFATILSLIVVLFFEETFWSIRNNIQRKDV